MKAVKPVLISGREVLPLVDGGRGINATDGNTAGAWAKAGAVGTFSGISADCYDADGSYLPEIFEKKTRQERQKELIKYAIKGALTQAYIAHEVSNGNGRIHINILWESGGSQEILEGVLEGAKGTVHGVVSGAGMPYKLGEICSSYGVYYYPIVSSGRAFKALWMRSYKKYPEFLGGVIYEDPWLAGGHNGLSNSEDPLVPEPHYGRVAELRSVMKSFGLENTPIIIAGGVWNLSEWEEFLDNPEIGNVAFQIGTRGLLVQESPILNDWKNKFLSLKEGDIKLQTFSPTGFYSSAINNKFIQRLTERLKGEVIYSNEKTDVLSEDFEIDNGKKIFVSKLGVAKAKEQIEKGFTETMKTPDNTIVFLTKEEKQNLKRDMGNCMGCLSMCRFSGWSQIHDNHNTGKLPDPRSFCIHKSLMEISHGGSVEDNIMFSGHKGHRYSTDIMYKDGAIPTVEELIKALMEGR